MSENEFERKIGELVAQINELPAEQRAPLLDIAAETRFRHDKIKQTVADLQESVDHLRLGVKYLVFDLEATRRENEHLRKLINRNHRSQG